MKGLVMAIEEMTTPEMPEEEQEAPETEVEETEVPEAEEKEAAPDDPGYAEYLEAKEKFENLKKFESATNEKSREAAESLRKAQEAEERAQKILDAAQMAVDPKDEPSEDEQIIDTKITPRVMTDVDKRFVALIDTLRAPRVEQAEEFATEHSEVDKDALFEAVPRFLPDPPADNPYWVPTAKQMTAALEQAHTFIKVRTADPSNDDVEAQVQKRLDEEKAKWLEELQSSKGDGEVVEVRPKRAELASDSDKDIDAILNDSSVPWQKKRKLLD